MILPASLVRNEILHLQVVVFNYLDTDLSNIRVYLSKTDDFKVIYHQYVYMRISHFY